jgi:hypothetical protein
MRTPAAPSLRSPAARPALIVLASYLAFFTWALWPWIRVASYGEPAGHLSNIEDHWLVAWIIYWVGNVVTYAPTHLFDVPINYPVPGQLAAIEHFLSSAVLVTPVLAATGNAVLAANVAALVSYPLAAFAMNRLLVEIGASAMVAWLGGAVFALGPERLPGNVLVLKYPNVYLPLVALCLSRLRREPDVRRALWLTLSLTLALLSSYYLAVLVLFAGGLWGACELARRGPDRVRYAVLALVATTAALAILAVVSIPYFARPEAKASAAEVSTVARQALDHAMMRLRVEMLGRYQLVVAALALVLLFWRGPAGVLARRGLVIALFAALMMLGSTQIVHGRAVTLPFAWLAATPASFFRYPFRFSVLLGFGVTLLFSAGLEGARRLFGVAGLVAAALVALLTLNGLVSRVAPVGIAEFSPIRRPIYAAVREAIRADGGDGPLLELPHTRSGKRAGRGYVVSVEMQSMLGWTIHEQPLVVGYVDFPPPHRPWLNVAIARLPAGNAVDDLVSMTRLKWLLLQPRNEWPDGAGRDKLMLLSGLTHVLALDGWDLLRVDRPARHPEWYDAVRAGQHRGQTILGTPIRKLGPDEARAAVWGALPERMEAGALTVRKVSVANVGTATWPSAAKGSQHLVRYQVRWWPIGVRPTPRNAVRTRRFSLPHDIGPGERLDLLAWLIPPPTPGRYRVEVKIVQSARSGFEGPDNVPLRGEIDVVPRRGDRPKNPANDPVGTAPAGTANDGAASAPR